MQKRNESLIKSVINYKNNGYFDAQISKLTGISRQRVGFILKKYKLDENGEYSVLLSDSKYQSRKLEDIIFPNIMDVLKRKNITFVDFCKMISDDGKYYYMERRFLIGETDTTSLSRIRSILKITGLSFEEAFKVREGETDETSGNV